MPKLRLLADSYDQPQKDDRPDRRQLVARSRGEVFDAVDQAEYDRLIAAGAAEDPAEVQKRAKQDAERRLAELEAERDRLEREIKATSPAQRPEKLSGKRLDAALAERDLPTDGSVEEKRARLAEALTAENPPPPPPA